MGAAVLTFIAEDQLQRAMIVLDIALARGCPYKRALAFALESLEMADYGANAQGMVERRWRLRQSAQTNWRAPQI